MSQPTDPAARETLGGTRKLTLLDATAQSIGFMGPVFSIAFLVPLLVGLNASGNGAGVAAPLSVLIAAVGVLGLGWTVAQYAKRIHAAGSLYDYVTDGLGARVGAAAGYLYYTGILVLGAGILVMVSGTIYDTFEAEFGIHPLPRLGWDLLLLALVGVILYLGVALSTRAQLVLALVSIVAFVAFYVYVIVKVGPANDVATAVDPSSSPQGFNGILFGVLYGVLLFTGFETAANLGEETARPKRDIPRAIIISVLAIAGFYVVGSYAQVAGYQFDLNLLGENAGAPVFGLAGPVADGGLGSVALRQLLELMVILDMIAVLFGCSVAASRGLFAMARDHRLPRSLATVSQRRTPVAAGAFVAAFYLLVIVLTQAWTGLFAQEGLPHYVAMFAWGSTYGSFALAVIYLLMSAGALRGLRAYATSWKVWLAGGVGIVVTGAAIFGSVYKVSAPIIWAPVAGVCVLVASFLVTWVVRGRAPATTTFPELTGSEAGAIKL